MRKVFIASLLLFLLCLTACSAKQENPVATATQTVTAEQTETTEEREMTQLTLKIEGQEIDVEWEENESVEALKQLAKSEPVTIDMSMYGGFEQVGSIGSSLPRNDVQMTSQAGDIVLYQGNQIVIFYGSNSWSYTKLGSIKSLSQEDLTELLGNGDVSITFYNE